MSGPVKVDVLVVGSGAAGLSAAVTAAMHGASVMVAEKASVLGGTSAWSGGWLWIPRNPLARAEGIDEAADAPLTYLSDAQQADGGFMSWGAANSESCAQVIVALTALGIDPAADSRFVKNGASPLDGLCAFACEGGGFRHSDEVWLPSRASTHWPPATASGRARHACST